MAVFKSLRTKSKEYVFKVFGNENLENPAKAVFARFPLPDENFIKAGSDARFNDVDWEKVGKKDPKETTKLFSVFINNYLSDMGSGFVPFSRVDYRAFLRECVDRFENLYSEEKGKGKKSEIKSVDDFLALPEAAVYEITRDLYAYAREKDDFSMGESKA
jgi:hypothetical protein